MQGAAIFFSALQTKLPDIFALLAPASIFT
jgi:hypothetical protein